MPKVARHPPHLNTGAVMVNRPQASKASARIRTGASLPCYAPSSALFGIRILPLPAPAQPRDRVMSQDDIAPALNVNAVPNRTSQAARAPSGGGRRPPWPANVAPHRKRERRWPSRALSTGATRPLGGLRADSPLVPWADKFPRRGTPIFAGLHHTLYRSKRENAPQCDSTWQCPQMWRHFPRGAHGPDPWASFALFRWAAAGFSTSYTHRIFRVRNALAAAGLRLPEIAARPFGIMYGFGPAPVFRIAPDPGFQPLEETRASVGKEPRHPLSKNPQCGRVCPNVTVSGPNRRSRLSAAAPSFSPSVRFASGIGRKRSGTRSSSMATRPNRTPTDMQNLHPVRS